MMEGRPVKVSQTIASIGVRPRPCFDADENATSSPFAEADEGDFLIQS